MHFAAAAVVASVAAAPAAAISDAPEATAQAQVRTERIWYGWQPLAGDLMAAGVFTLGAAGESGNVELAGAAIFPLAAPLIHLAHGHPLRALGSFGLRLAVPIGGFFLGASVQPMFDKNCAQEELCGLGGAIIGGRAGTLVAAVIDDGVLSWDEKPAASFVERIAPSVAVRGNSGLLALRGTF